MKIFISYSTKNEEIARRVLGHLEESGFPCFYAPRDIRIGCVYAEEIVNGIDSCDAMVFVLTKESNTSAHVLREIERAVSLNIPILTYRIEEVQLTKAMEYFLMATQWTDADALGNDLGLVRSLCVLFNRPMPEPKPKPQIVQQQPVAQQQIQAEMPQKGQEMVSETGSKKRAIIVSIIVTLVVCLILGFTIWIVVKNKDDDNSSSHKSKKQVEEDDDFDEDDDDIDDFEDADIEEIDWENFDVRDYYSIGDTVTFGYYNDEWIDWRIVNINYDGTAVMIADQVLTFKCFDAAESGKEMQKSDGESVSAGMEFTPKDFHDAYGNNNWEVSNLRTWLNSGAEQVSYLDTAPVKAAVFDGASYYSGLPGFLNGFEEEEIAVLVDHSHRYQSYIIPEDATWVIGSETTEWTIPENKRIYDRSSYCNDKVWVPSVNDLPDLQAAGISFYAKPTDTALQAERSQLYRTIAEETGSDNMYYWTCDSAENSAFELAVINAGQSEKPTDVGRAFVSYGVRPMICVDLKQLYMIQ